MALRLVQVNFKARDDAALGRFWARALGWGMSSEGPGVTNLVPEDVEWPDPAAVCIDLVAVPDPETVAYRASLELGTGSAAEYAETVARFVDLGAAVVGPRRGAGAVPAGTVFADPEGNEFVVLEPGVAEAGTGPIAAIVVDCFDPRGLARFWDAALDWTLHEVGDERARLRSSKGVGPYLEFRRAPVGAGVVRGRVHLDVMPYAGDDQGVEAARLRGLGARDVDLGQGVVSWVVLADPEGNEFCLLSSG